MKNGPGTFIVLEGSDGSGKATQFNLLAERLKATGYEVEVFDFPQYAKESSHFVKEYLNGAYGPATQISPYTASLFYALDRYEASHDIQKALEDGKIVLSNRYVGSNMAHQGGKFSDTVEQRGFFVWADNLEFQLLGIPRPTLNLFLRVPAETSYELIKQKKARSYTAKTHDEHEKDLSHLKKTVATFDLLCRLFPKDFTAIECTKDGELMSIPEINNLIWSTIKPLLPVEKPNPSHSVVVTLGELDETTDEPQSPNGKLEHTFKNSSRLLYSILLQSIPNTSDAGLWSDSKYKHYTPRGLSKQLEAQYKASISRIAELHGQIASKIETSGLDGTAGSTILQTVTPLAALCDFRISLEKDEVGPLCVKLLSSPLEETAWAAKQLYAAARQKWPGDFNQAIEADKGAEVIQTVLARLTDDKLSRGDSEGLVKLLEASPRQEFDLLAESIFPFSNLSLDEITEDVSEWPYQQKYESLRRAAVQPELLTEKVFYKFDIISDQPVMDELIKTAKLENVSVQQPTPRYGYEVPEDVEEADAEDLFLGCFDESLKLYSRLQASDNDELAAYACLLGHRTRWQLKINAKRLNKLLQHSGSQTYQKIINSLSEAVNEVHPLLWEVLGNPPQPENVSQPRNGKNRVKPSRRNRRRPPKKAR
ncbi:MAG TPA: hypothetical protein VFP32_04165 [Candidatus Saccharimonadales bacterium]|nr:hypothetical protein [Candidatus Saccharimonadales bacterium]